MNFEHRSTSEDHLSSSANGQSEQTTQGGLPIDIFKISPLIRLTLLALYLALTVPLPFLSQLTEPRISLQLLWLGISLGGIALYAALSEQVVITAEEIRITYPNWVPRVFRRGWSLPWTELKALKPRSTGQGGLVYYCLGRCGQAYLLPMRVAGFARLVGYVQTYTGIDTRDVRPLAQPWMYFILLALTLLLLLIDSWVVWAAIS